MLGITRQNICRGPGRLTLGSTVIDSKDGMTLSQEASSADIASDLNGYLGTIRTDQLLKVGITPYGRITGALLAALYPAWMRTPAIGSSVFGAADIPCVIHSAAGKKVTLFAAAVTTPPPLILSAVATAFGAAEITALLANGKLPGETDALIKVEDAAWTGTTAQARPQTGARYTAAFGEAAFAETVAGFTTAFNFSSSPLASDNAGTLDVTFSGIRPECRFTPLDKSETDIITLLGLNSPRGSYMGSGENLVITGTNGLVLTLYNCDVLQGPINWGVAALRAGELMFRASPDPETGMVFDIAFEDPEA